jgi:hypothetical protein
MRCFLAFCSRVTARRRKKPPRSEYCIISSIVELIDRLINQFCRFGWEWSELILCSVFMEWL